MTEVALPGLLIMPDTLSWFQKIVADIDFTYKVGYPCRLNSQSLLKPYRAQLSRHRPKQ